MKYEVKERVIPPNRIPYYLIDFEYKNTNKTIAIDAKFWRYHEDRAIKWILDNWEVIEDIKK